jgi:enolase
MVVYDLSNPFEIVSVNAIMVLDSRGNPTLEVEVETNEGTGVGIAPAGASKGKREAVDLRDGGKSFGGMGVQKAIESVRKYIAPTIIGMNSFYFREVDKAIIQLDGTPNKSRLGGNATTATSIAVINAAASTAGMPLFEFIGGRRARTLPTPMMNIINGGAHAGNDLAIQEFMIVPIGADSFFDAMRIAVDIYKQLKKELKEKYGPSAINVGDEGGFAPPMKRTQEALTALVKAVKDAGYSEGDVMIALDAAASQFFESEGGKYRIDGISMSPDDLIEYYSKLIDEYPIISIEDPFSEEDPAHFAELRRRVKGKALIIGDDLTVTRSDIILDMIRKEAIDGAIIKINQVGTVTEAEEAIETLQLNKKKAIISHRSGETEDVTIAHLAVGYGTGLIKTGAPARGERTVKYNELLRIEAYLGGEAIYLGKNAFV